MNLIRKAIQKTGLDLHRYRPAPDKLSYLRLFNFRTVLDIGANVGQFAREIRQILPNASIHSFEPIKECFDKLNQNMKEDSNFKSFNFALGDKNENLEMHKSVYTPSSSILEMAEMHKTLFPHTKENEPEEIKVKRLDEVVKNLDLKKEVLIKIDVQGFEDKVIDGGRETFKKARVVLIENSFVEMYKNQPLFDDIYEKLKSLGFTYKGGLQEKLDKKTGQILFEDSLFTKFP
jgi:FkbM family methyltransferase